MRIALLCLALCLMAAGIADRRIRRTTVTESEPNDSFPVADSIALYDTVSGAIGYPCDEDYFGIDLVANTFLELDVDAQALGSTLDPVLFLFGPDGALVAHSDDYGLDHDSHVEYAVRETGRYFIDIFEHNLYECVGDESYFYLINTGTFTYGPGDPVTVFAGGTNIFAPELGFPLDVAASATGDYYVADFWGVGRIMRLTPTGGRSVLAVTDTAVPSDLVIDGFGNLLVTMVPVGGGSGWIQRYTPTGQASVFASGFADGLGAITVGPDGDVWVANLGAGFRIYRLSPTGANKGYVSAATGVWDLAFSPSGELHYSGEYSGVFKIVGTSTVPVISRRADGIAFDQDGYLYVASWREKRIYLYDAGYQLVYAPFARTNLDGPHTMVFGRSDTGTMTSRLFATNEGQLLDLPPTIVEMNTAGVRAPGFRVGVDLLPLATTSLRDGIVGRAYHDTVRMANPPGPVTWTVSPGTLPPGLQLGAASGEIWGIPEQRGTYEVELRASSAGQLGYGRLTVTVTNPQLNTADAADHFLIGTPLSIDLQRYLDLQGNRNDRYDLGDLRIFLRAVP